MLLKVAIFVLNLSKMKQLILSTSFLAIIACLLWSTAFAGIKIGLQYTPPLQFAGIRFFLSGLMIIPLIPSIKIYITTLKTNYLSIISISLLQTVLLYLLFYSGISLLPGSITAITIGAQPLFIAVISHIMLHNDKLSFRKVLSISLGILGIILIAVNKGITDENGSKKVLGILLLIGSNICSGLGNVVVSKQKNKIHPIILSSWQLLLGGIGLFIISLITEPFQGFVFPLPYYLSLGWLSFLSAAAFTIWFILLQRPNTKVSDLNIWKFIIPVFGAILSWLILPDEYPELVSVAGMVIIGISLIWYNLLTKSKRR